MEKVSIISVNYNQPEVTIEFLKSLRMQDYKNIEVILVDNGSKVDHQKLFTSTYKDLIYVRSEQNLGFAGGNNLGISRATGAYLLFLNNDTIVPNRTIGKLVDSLNGIPKAGIVCPLIYDYAQRNVLQYAGYSKVSLLTGRNETIGLNERWPLSHQIKETHYPHGAAMMLKKEVIMKSGKMPENFFLYYEELDWASQIRKAGFKCFVDHRVKIYHNESTSTGKTSTLKTYFLTRNRILFMRRNSNLVGNLIFFSFFFLVSTPKNVLNYLLKGQIDHLNAFLAGIRWNIFNTKNSYHLGYIFNHLNQTVNGTIQSSKLGKAA